MDKKELRKSLMGKRSEYPKELREKMDKKAFENLIKTEEYKNSENIFVFISFRDEIDTHEAVRYFIKDNKNVFIPYTEEGKEKMRLTRLKDMEDLVPGHFGILSPKKEDLDFIDHNIIDLVLVPGLAFDDEGYRIGYGGGFYDKFFADLISKPKKIGYCYSFQLIDKIPHDDYDIPVDMVITD